MRIFVKICGFTTPDAVAAAVEAGADALGFVFVQSPRQVTPAEAARLCRDVPEAVRRVAVMRHPEDAEWQAVRALFRPDWLQTDAADFAMLNPGAGVKRIPVYRDGDELPDPSMLGDDDLLLYESAQSGTGQLADLERAAALARRARVIVAGGLDPDNVAGVIARVRPFGVDVSSGVEKSRGRKDPARIRAFVAAVREAEKAYAD